MPELSLCVGPGLISKVLLLYLYVQAMPFLTQPVLIIYISDVLKKFHAKDCRDCPASSLRFLVIPQLPTEISRLQTIDFCQVGPGCLQLYSLLKKI